MTSNARIHNFAVSTLADDIELVVFGWSNKKGHCYECGAPAAYFTGTYASGTAAECEAKMRAETDGERGCANPSEHEPLTHQLRCSVCAAMAAADGEVITWMYREEFA